MTAHDHTEYVDGCFRCDLSREETREQAYEALANDPEYLDYHQQRRQAR